MSGEQAVQHGKSHHYPIRMRWTGNTEDTGGHFTEAILRPTVTLDQGSDMTLAESLHDRAHHLCYVANSINFPVRCEPRTCFRS